MPAPIRARNGKFIKSLGVLKTAWIGLFHGLNYFSLKDSVEWKKTAKHVKKLIFWKKSHVLHAGMNRKTAKLFCFMFSYDYTTQDQPEELDGLKKL